MEDSNNLLQFKDDTLEFLIYENFENLPPNYQSVQYNDDTVSNNSKENLNIRINDNKNNLPENIEEPTTQTKSVYKVLEDSYMQYSDYGEPFKPQHIRIAYTPVPGPLLDFGSKSRSGIENKSSITKSRDLDEVKKLCLKMEEWYLSHPKSMESPNTVLTREDLKFLRSVLTPHP